MHYCDKCGEAIHDINNPCPTCGMIINPNINSNDTNNKFLNIFIVLIIVGGLGFGLFIFLGNRSFSNEDINFAGKNYSFYYEGENWTKSDMSTDEYLILQNTNDLNAHLQLPNKASEHNVDLSNEDLRDSLYNYYMRSFANDSDYSYNNASSKFKKLGNTDNYYISTDFYMYEDSSFRGKFFVVISPSGKAIDILFMKGSKDISKIEKEIIEVLENIKM